MGVRQHPGRTGVGASATTETARPGHGSRGVALALSRHAGHGAAPPRNPRRVGNAPDRVAPSQHLGARTASCSKAGTGPAATTGASACTVRGGVQTVASINPEDPPWHDELNGQRRCPGGAAHAYGGTTASHADTPASIATQRRTPWGEQRREWVRRAGPWADTVHPTARDPSPPAPPDTPR